MSVHNLKSNSRHLQRGTFSIEFAIVGMFFSLLLVFSGDVIIKLSVKGKLDRLSYSLVNVVKERTQLYEADYELSKREVDDIDTIARHSLMRTFGRFQADRYGLLVEEQSFEEVDKPNDPVREHRGTLDCDIGKPISQLQDLSVVSNRGRQMPIYRVSICYQTDNWIGDLLGTQFTRVESDSVVIGR
ncbi:tight adherence pilus pseudopilin TadF [Vibrio alfacsensis]|uniref:tight adherence pilus pseudopilin TadF n=1 Tax=Vibrio alfacsensis TaxID=1074311 RepID=UPI002ADD8F34|nr:tight adherence pilus pseudopilin TadF [Vibrio alfacsensis]WQE76244.1 tight adherence pilus pseudopilin TadF [Vibrio alfacsensis]